MHIYAQHPKNAFVIISAGVVLACGETSSPEKAVHGDDTGIMETGFVQGDIGGPVSFPR